MALTKYHLIRESLNTGDLVLFSGRGLWSRLIKIGTISRWTHVGVVIRLPDYYDGVMLLESTTMSKTADVFTGRVTRGVALVPLSSRIASYPGKVGIRRLINVPRDHDFIAAFAWLRRTLNGKAYERNLFELVASAIDMPFFRNRKNLKTVFCSELVAEGYKRAGLLAGGMPSNEYTPADFATLEPLRGTLTRMEMVHDG